MRKTIALDEILTSRQLSLGFGPTQMLCMTIQNLLNHQSLPPMQM